MKPDISVIGCGRVGTCMAVALSKAGYRLAGLASRTRASAQKAAAAACTGTVFDHAADAARTGSVVFITTPDDVIADVCKDLVSDNGFSSGSIVFHCSGALSSEILTSAKQIGCKTGSLHPLQSFAPYETGQSSPFNGINMSVEGDPDAVEAGLAIVKDLGAISFTLPTQAKILYHAAAVVASNYLVTLEQFALKLLMEAEISEARAFEILEPLIQGTLGNIKKHGTSAALTGPIARGDVDIVERHLKDIEATFPLYLPLYKLMGRLTLDIARKRGGLEPASDQSLSRLFKT